MLLLFTSINVWRFAVYMALHICILTYLKSVPLFWTTLYSVYWCKNSCRTVYGNSNGFEVKVGMHQGSALSPLLFVMVMEDLSREFRVALP